MMVYLSSGSSQSLTIPAASKTHSSDSWLKSSGKSIELYAHDLQDSTAKQTIVRFHDQATQGFDLEHDAYYLHGFAPVFYSVSEGKKYGVNTLPEYNHQTEIPLVFEKKEGMEYSIEMTEGLDSQEVFLEDLKTNTTVNLTEQGSYEFTAAEGDDPQRFHLKFSTVGVEEEEAIQYYAYTVDKRLIINNLDEPSGVSVYNLNGQLMSRFETDGSKRFEKRLDLPEGIYMVRIQNSESITSKKILIK